MEIKTKRIITKSPKNDKQSENKSLDRYKEFLGEKKDVKKSKDKKVFHVTRKRFSPKKIKKIQKIQKIQKNPRDLLQIENDIADMKSEEKPNSIQMPTQNENLTTELQGLNNNDISQPDVQKPAEQKRTEQNPTEQKPLEQKSTEQKHVVKKQDLKKPRKNTRRSVGRTNKKSKTRGRNRRVSIKNSTFSDKDFKDIQVKLKEIRNKKSGEIKSELEKKGVKVSGKSNRLLRDIYLYSKLSNINITHEK
jgi:hypothetical protein